MTFRDDVAVWLEGVLGSYPGGITALALKAGVPRSTVYAVKDRKIDPSDRILKALADAGGVPVPRRTITTDPPADARAIAARIESDARRLQELMATVAIPDVRAAGKAVQRHVDTVDKGKKGKDRPA